MIRQERPADSFLRQAFRERAFSEERVFVLERHYALDIASNRVDFDVNVGLRFEMLQGGHFKRMRNEINGNKCIERRILDLVDREDTPLMVMEPL